MSHHSFGKWEITHEQDGERHRLNILGIGTSGWVPTSLPITYQSADDSFHLVAQLICDRLPKVFQLIAEDNHALEIMELNQ